MFKTSTFLVVAGLVAGGALLNGATTQRWSVIAPDPTRTEKLHATELRFEDMGLAFQEKARAGFLALAARHPRFCVIDADGDADTVAARVLAALAPHLPPV